LRPGDILIIPKIDRAFRSFGDFVAMLQRWEDLKVRVILVDPSFEYDPNNPFTKTTLRMLAAFAELERELVSLRTKEGLELRIRQRVRYCHHAPYGYAWTNIQRDGRWVQVAQPDPTEQQIMRRIVLMRNTDPPHSWTQIREYLNYELRIPPRQNRGAVAADWDVQRIRRIYQAALRDQIRNAGQLA
jgi:DNA invertase Pin-like site-specific DNA recombinase